MKQPVKRHGESRGFSLIELLVVISLMAILASMVVPSYSGYTRAAKRSEAMQGLLSAQLAQAEWRARHANYAHIAELPISLNTTNYQFRSSQISANSYTLTATATGAQAADEQCLQLQINERDEKTPADCWR